MTDLIIGAISGIVISVITRLSFILLYLPVFYRDYNKLFKNFEIELNHFTSLESIERNKREDVLKETFDRNRPASGYIKESIEVFNPQLKSYAENFTLIYKKAVLNYYKRKILHKYYIKLVDISNDYLEKQKNSLNHLLDEMLSDKFTIGVQYDAKLRIVELIASYQVQIINKIRIELNDYESKRGNIFVRYWNDIVLKKG